MTGLALTLVLLSSLFHPAWNFLSKRSVNTQVFVGWLLVADSVLLVPLGIVLLLVYPVSQPGWWFVIATIGLHAAYFGFLGRGYAEGDLSVVYPLARGIGPILVPILAVSFLDESVSAPAGGGIALIVIGVFTVAWASNAGDLGRWSARRLVLALRYPMLVGLTTAAYSLVDKQGVDHVQPFLYMYLTTLGSAVVLVPYLVASQGMAAVWSEWKSSGWVIVGAGLCVFLAYGLVLTAFSMSRVSYVAPAREVGIVVGVLLGVLVLKESFGARRLAGSVLIVAGLAMLALAP